MVGNLQDRLKLRDSARLQSGESLRSIRTEIASMHQATEFFDKKFVYAACAIGAAYALIIAGLGFLLGKEAAGVAGVALTALAAAIFKQFETLRFKRIAEQEERTVSIPRLNIPYLILLVCAFQGIQLFLGLLLRAIFDSFGWFKLNPSATLESSFGSLFTDYRFLASVVGVVALSYFAGGYLCGRTAPRVSFSYALIGSMLSLFLVMLLQEMSVMALDWREAVSIFTNPVLYVAGIFWGVYAACAFLGARIGFRGRALFPESHRESV